MLGGNLGLAELLDWALERRFESRIFQEEKPWHRAQAPRLSNERPNEPSKAQTGLAQVPQAGGGAWRGTSWGVARGWGLI